ncbi:unnamed protein product [Toxocara canis]|uniref:RRM domain-containing protein n=1 Tax=Toxocara canis TaxID=6265 RepID=A0A183U5Z1_TOXCA|nr:unnamed protein product [Toxocara canis]
MPSRVLNSPQNVVTMGRFADCYQPTYGQMITSALTQSNIYNLSNANEPYQPPAHGVPRVWNGELLPRTYNNPVFSCKVFVGGIPWDITEQAVVEEPNFTIRVSPTP